MSKVVKCMRRVDDWKMHVALNGKLLEKPNCFKCEGLHVAVDGGHVGS